MPPRPRERSARGPAPRAARHRAPPPAIAPTKPSRNSRRWRRRGRARRPRTWIWAPCSSSSAAGRRRRPPCARRSISLRARSRPAFQARAGPGAAAAVGGGRSAAYREAVRLKPRHALAHFRLGLMCRRQDKRAEEEAALRRAVDIAPALADAHVDLAGNAGASGAPCRGRGRDTAWPSRRPAPRDRLRGPGRSSPCPRVASTRRRAPSPSAHLYDLRRLRSLVHLADALRRARRFGEAAARYREAIRQRPGLARLHGCLGLALWRLRRHSEAAAAWRDAARLDPERGLWHRWHGVALDRMGRLPEAVAAFGRRPEREWRRRRRPGWGSPR